MKKSTVVIGLLSGYAINLLEVLQAIFAALVILLGIMLSLKILFPSIPPSMGLILSDFLSLVGLYTINQKMINLIKVKIYNDFHSKFIALRSS